MRTAGLSLVGEYVDTRPGQLKQVSVGNSTAVWGVNSADKIFRWDGQAWDQFRDR